MQNTYTKTVLRGPSIGTLGYVLLSSLLGCSGASAEPSIGSGGTLVVAGGGTTATGGITAPTGTGGANPIGGAATSGGTTVTSPIGGAATSGGMIATDSMGGALATGGGGTSGGARQTGGSAQTGGTQTTGGATATGGIRASGGSPITGGAGQPGGSAQMGGTQVTGGSIGSSAGGTGGATTGCSETSSGYFVDSSAGNDASDGKTPATAWKSLSKLNSTLLNAGDRVCLRAGSSWTGQLAPQGSGSSVAPIVIDKYGSGTRPKISAGSSDKNAVSLVNNSYIEVNNLEIVNQKSSPGDYRGISVVGRDAGTLNHVYIRGCFVHDVTGHVNWIGGDVADNQPGVTFKTGWDASKRTGGIVFEVTTSAARPVKTLFNDVILEGNVVRDCSFGGIIFKQLDGSVHWGIRDSASDPDFAPHTNVVIRNNYINQHNTSLGCNGIYMTAVQTGSIEGNVVAEAGTSAIEIYYTDAVTIQRNETYGTVRKANGADFNGIDADKATTKSLIQYNYVHDNGDGILLCQFAFGDSIVRYNVIQNSSRYQIYLHSDSKATSAIYNNTFYNDKYNSSLTYGYGDFIVAPYTFTNNIFVSTKTNAVLTTGGGIAYHNNLYFGPNVSPPSSDSRAVKSDPKLMNPGQGTSGTEAGPAFGSLNGYKLAAGSPAINAGTSMQNNGGRDFFGTALYVGAADVGAVESQ